MDNIFLEPKLTIELVPSTCWFSNVRSSVSSAHWDRIRKMSSKLANNMCQICGGKGPKWPVECHEIWGYNDSTKTQTLINMISLCPSCHEVKHIGFAQLNGNGDRATSHLAKVNNWTKEMADQYVQESFLIWRKRSSFEWKLDLSFLTSLGIKKSEIKSR
jgi:hypothetical protein